MFFGGGGGQGGGGGGQPNFFFPGFAPPGGFPGPGQNGGPPGAFNPLEMLFSGGFGGGGGPGQFNPGDFEMDPTLMANLFGPGAAGGFPMGGQAEAAPERIGAPPTARSTLRSLPRVKVSSHDIEKNESNECSICLDALVIGEPALRIPCGHLFHEDCVEDWLKKSNECPVCRYELPTDDAAYEEGRRERMAGRKIRLRLDDISVKSAAELRRFAQFLKLDVTGCLEKSEFVERIAASDQVEILDPREATQDASSCSLFDYASTAPASVAQARQDSSSAEPRAMDVDVSMDGDARDGDVSSDMREKRPREPDPPVPAAVHGPLTGQSVAKLRQLAKELNVSLDGCLEKGDIIQRIRAAPGYREA